MATSLFQFKRMCERAGYDPAKHRLRMTIEVPAREKRPAHLMDINGVTAERVEAEYAEGFLVMGVGVWPLGEGPAIEGTGLKNRFGEKFPPPPFQRRKTPAWMQKTEEQIEAEKKFGHLRNASNMRREQAKRANANQPQFAPPDFSKLN